LNAAHINGVKVIGTIIFEHGDGTRNLTEILKSREIIEESSKALVNIAKNLKFEGWFFNVEVSLEPGLIENLKYFVEFLTKLVHEEIPNGKVIWYDSITEDGTLVWQNELNTKNDSFFELSDGIFTNYNWKSENLDRSSQLIDLKYPKRRQDVYIGLDVFGRGQIAGFQSASTVSKIMPYDFSLAIFAPGWTHENVDVSKFFCETGSDEWREKMNSSFLERNDRFWSSLYQFFHLDGPKTLPFVTNFCLGSGKNLYRMGAKVKGNWFNLKHQNFIPSTPAKQGVFKYYYDDAFDGGNSIIIHTTEMTRLFVCEFDSEENLIFSYTIKRFDDASNDLQFRLNMTNVITGRQSGFYTDTNGIGNESQTITTCERDGETKEIERFFSSQHYPTFKRVINGWETRYYLMEFENKTKVTDIGFRKLTQGKILLGHLAFYSAKGFNLTNCDSVNRIEL
jgi:mannosyl-glycoprotein endo-beta-N-acetylglucosaminidase